MNAAPNQLSFLPDDYLVRKAQHRTNLICASLFVVMIAAIAIAFTTVERGLRDAERRHAAIDQQYADAAKRIAEMKQLQDRQAVLARQADLAASLLDRVPRSYLLAEITNKLPAGVSLRDVELSRKKRANAPGAEKKTPLTRRKASAKDAKAAAALPPPPEQFDVFVKLSGVAPGDAQVAKFVSNLNESPLLAEVNLLLSAQLERGDPDAAGMRRFNLEMQLSPSADIRPAANAPAASKEPVAQERSQQQQQKQSNQQAQATVTQ
jgi:Tfp pilus assembly protein PilN